MFFVVVTVYNSNLSRILYSSMRTTCLTSIFILFLLALRQQGRDTCLGATSSWGKKLSSKHTRHIRKDHRVYFCLQRSYNIPFVRVPCQSFFGGMAQWIYIGCRSWSYQQQDLSKRTCDQGGWGWMACWGLCQLTWYKQESEYHHSSLSMTHKYLLCKIYIHFINKELDVWDKDVS